MQRRKVREAPHGQPGKVRIPFDCPLEEFQTQLAWDEIKLVGAMRRYYDSWIGTFEKEEGKKKKREDKKWRRIMSRFIVKLILKLSMVSLIY